MIEWYYTGSDSQIPCAVEIALNPGSEDGSGQYIKDVKEITVYADHPVRHVCTEVLVNTTAEGISYVSEVINYFPPDMCQAPVRFQEVRERERMRSRERNLARRLKQENIAPVSVREKDEKDFFFYATQSVFVYVPPSVDSPTFDPQAKRLTVRIVYDTTGGRTEWTYESDKVVHKKRYSPQGEELEDTVQFLQKKPAEPSKKAKALAHSRENDKDEQEEATPAEEVDTDADYKEDPENLLTINDCCDEVHYTCASAKESIVRKTVKREKREIRDWLTDLDANDPEYTCSFTQHTGSRGR